MAVLTPLHCYKLFGDIMEKLNCFMDECNDL